MYPFAVRIVWVDHKAYDNRVPCFYERGPPGVPVAFVCPNTDPAVSRGGMEDEATLSPAKSDRPHEIPLSPLIRHRRLPTTDHPSHVHTPHRCQGIQAPVVLNVQRASVSNWFTSRRFPDHSSATIRISSPAPSSHRKLYRIRPCF